MKTEVVFAEIDALYDLPGRRLVLSGDRPQVAIDNHVRDPLLVTRHGMPRFVDETGASIDERADDVPGMYCAVRAGGSAPFWRSFSRRRALPITRKFVYIFSADIAVGGGLRLEQELYFDKGLAYSVDLTANAGRNVRAPAKVPLQLVHLEVVRTTEGKTVRPSYFGLLAPMQIPWRRLQTIAQNGSVTARCSRLGDAFWTDGFTRGDPTTAKTFHELFRGGARPDSLGLLLYLVDPFKEALQRFDRLQAHLDGWLALQASMARDEQYALAKRIDAFAHGYGLDTEVRPELPEYLLRTESAVFKSRLAAEDACEDLVRWVGHPQQSDFIDDVDVRYVSRHGKAYSPKRKQPYPPAPCNPFSDAVRDYLEADADTLETVTRVANAVQARLAETTAGSAWMNDAFDSLLATRFPVATAGAELLFDRHRGASGATSKAWAPLFTHWAPLWAKRQRREATANLQRWLAATHGVEVPQVRASELKRDWRSVHTNERTDPDLSWLDPNRSRVGSVGETTARHLSLGIDLFNIAQSVNGLRNVQDGWHALRLAGSVADFCADAARLSTELRQSRNTVHYAGTTRVLNAPPPVVGLACAMNPLLSDLDTPAAKSISDRVQASLRSVGTAFTLSFGASDTLAEVGGAPPDATGGAGLQAIRLMLELVGAFRVAGVDKARSLLQASEWGTNVDAEGGLRSVGRSDFNEVGTAESRSDDRRSQLRAVSELIYDFLPTLELKEQPAALPAVSLFVRTGTPGDKRSNPLSSASRWNIDLAIDRGDGKAPETWTFRFEGRGLHVDASMDEPVLVRSFTQAEETRPEVAGHVVVTGTVKLAPFGVGGFIVERKIERVLDRGWFGR